jgi:3-isopropylmalate dehydrogenase
MKKNIAVLPGDGIGPEITKEGIKVLDAIAKRFSHQFIYHEAPFGGNAWFSDGSCFPEKTKKICDEADAIIKGPVGLSYEKTNTIPPKERPEIAAILPLRERYNTFANFRPVYLPAELKFFSPLKESVITQDIDIMMIRELVGGIYFGKKIEGFETDNEFAEDQCLYRGKEVRQIAHAAFQEARKKYGRLTNVHKANVLATSRFWCVIVEEVKKEYPDVTYNSILVDNAAFQLVINPAQFNGVMLLDNMQGDILSDEGGGIIGSLGLMPSACIGPEKGYVEPAHGSAPDIAGRNIANPYSMIGSVALMLEKCFQLKKEADAVWKALRQLFAAGYRTHDLKEANTEKAKILGTDQFGDRVVKNILEGIT